jgi:hypothetical protein
MGCATMGKIPGDFDIHVNDRNTLGRIQRIFAGRYPFEGLHDRGYLRWS